MLYFYDNLLDAFYMQENHGFKYQLVASNGEIHPAKVTKNLTVKFKRTEEQSLAHFGYINDNIRSLEFDLVYADLFLDDTTASLLTPRISDLVIVQPELHGDDDEELIRRGQVVGWAQEHLSPNGQMDDACLMVDSLRESWLGLVRDKKYLTVIQRNEKPFIVPKVKKLSNK